MAFYFPRMMLTSAVTSAMVMEPSRFTSPCGNTLMVILLDTPFAVQVIMVAPVAKAVTTPSSDTVATDELLLVQAAFEVPVATRAWVEPVVKFHKQFLSRTMSRITIRGT